MASGKKGKKHKGKTIPLTDFLADGTSGPGPGKVIVQRNRTWADEVENDDDCCYMGSRNKQVVILPTAPREARSCRNIDEENIPKNPPFKAYIVNLHYDTNENDIMELFGDIKIVDVQLPRGDRGSGRLKGFGYIEFDTRDDLIAALMMEDTSIKGRRMRIEVSTNNDIGGSDRRFGASDRRFENRDYDPERTQGDWRSGPREEPTMPNKPDVDRDVADGPKDRGAFTRSNMDGPLTRDMEGSTRGDMNQSPYTRYNADNSRESRSFTRDNMNQMVGPRDYPGGVSNNAEASRESRSFTRENMNQMVGPRDYPGGGSNNAEASRESRSFTRENMNQMVGSRDYPGGGSNNAEASRESRSFTRENMNQMVGPRDYHGGGLNNSEASRESRSFTRENMNQMVGPRDYHGGGMNRETRGSGNDGRFGNRQGNRDNTPRGGNYNNYQERDRYGSHGGNRRDRNNSYHSNDRGYHRPYSDHRTSAERETSVEERARPKLCLARRTTPNTGDGHEVSTQSAIFGGATPVDTAARERTMEVNHVQRRQANFTRRLEIDEVSEWHKSYSIVRADFDGSKTVGSADDHGLEVAQELRPVLAMADRFKRDRQNVYRRETPVIEILKRVPKELTVVGGAIPVNSTVKDVKVDERFVKREKEEDNYKVGSEMESSMLMQDLVQVPECPSIFGGSSLVDTSAKDLEVADRLSKPERVKQNSDKMEMLQDLAQVPERPSIFGGASLVDTSAKELEVADRISKLERVNQNYDKIEILQDLVQVPERPSIFGGASLMDTSAKEPKVADRLSKPESSYQKSDKMEILQDLAQVPERASIFGRASPVVTSAKDLEVADRLSKPESLYQKSEKMVESQAMRHLDGDEERSTIFGGAKPVDTSSREREVEQRFVRAREEKRPREKKEGRFRGESQIHASTSASGGGRPAETTHRDRETQQQERFPTRDRETRRRNTGYNNEKQLKKFAERPQPAVKKFELAKPPAENVWHRRAAQQAADKERQQQVFCSTNDVSKYYT